LLELVACFAAPQAQKAVFHLGHLNHQRELYIASEKKLQTDSLLALIKNKETLILFTIAQDQDVSIRCCLL
jgi:hypothetical protein